MSSEGYFGKQDANSGAGEYNALFFTVTQILTNRHHNELVQVVAVTNNGGVSPVGFVDVQPMVNQLDGEGNAIPHGVINSMPYFRLQGGADAIILDPKVGDIGIAVIADRDISSVKASKKIANPGSMRQADMADGLYLGGVLNGMPQQFVQFSTAGVRVVSPTKITLVAPAIELDGAVTMTSTAIAATSVTSPLITGTTDVVYATKSAVAHRHSGVQTGLSNTGTTV